MILNNGNYKIEKADSLNIGLYKLATVKSKKNGTEKQEYKCIGYYGGSLKMALNGYLRNIEFDIADNSAKEIINKIDEAIEEIKKINYES